MLFDGKISVCLEIVTELKPFAFLGNELHIAQLRIDHAVASFYRFAAVGRIGSGAVAVDKEHVRFLRPRSLVVIRVFESSLHTVAHDENGVTLKGSQTENK